MVVGSGSASLLRAPVAPVESPVPTRDRPGPRRAPAGLGARLWRTGASEGGAIDGDDDRPPAAGRLQARRRRRPRPGRSTASKRLASATARLCCRRRWATPSSRRERRGRPGSDPGLHGHDGSVGASCCSALQHLPARAGPVRRPARLRPESTMSTTASGPVWQAPGITHTDLQRHGFSAPGREVNRNRAGISVPRRRSSGTSMRARRSSPALGGNAGMPPQRPAADDGQRRRGADRRGRDDPRGARRRQRQRS